MKENGAKKAAKPAPVREVPKRRLFKVNKIFAQWLVPMEVSEDDDYDTLLRKAMKEIEDKNILPFRPEPDHVLEEA